MAKYYDQYAKTEAKLLSLKVTTHQSLVCSVRQLPIYMTLYMCIMHMLTLLSIINYNKCTQSQQLTEQNHIPVVGLFKSTVY